MYFTFRHNWPQLSILLQVDCQFTTSWKRPVWLLALEMLLLVKEWWHVVSCSSETDSKWWSDVLMFRVLWSCYIHTASSLCGFRGAILTSPQLFLCLLTDSRIVCRLLNWTWQSNLLKPQRKKRGEHTARLAAAKTDCCTCKKVAFLPQPLLLLIIEKW